jgi:cytochrome c biogenesis protein CcmG/thiol:disulfide interchange protein DsbE
MLNLRAFIVVLVFAAVLVIPFYIYWEGLTQANRPPQSTVILNEMEKSGVPDFKLPDLNGNDQALSQFKGKIIILNFWASWCAPCVKEFPSLQRLADHFKGKVIVVAASHDRNRDDLDSFVLAMAKRDSDNFHIWWDKDRAIGKMYGTEVLPETFIIGQDMKLLRKVAGEDEWDSPPAIRFFEELISPN